MPRAQTKPQTLYGYTTMEHLREQLRNNNTARVLVDPPNARRGDDPLTSPAAQENKERAAAPCPVGYITATATAPPAQIAVY